MRYCVVESHWLVLCMQELEQMQSHRQQIEAELRHMTGGPGRGFSSTDARLGSELAGDAEHHYSPRQEAASSHSQHPHHHQQRGSSNPPHQQSRDGPRGPYRASEGERYRHDNDYHSWNDEAPRGGRGGGGQGHGSRPSRGFSHDMPPRTAGRPRDEDDNGYCTFACA